MNKAGGGSLILAGIFLVFLGIVISSDILESLLDILGILVIVIGAIMGIVGLVQMFSSGNKSSSSF